MSVGRTVRSTGSSGQWAAIPPEWIVDTHSAGRRARDGESYVLRYGRVLALFGHAVRSGDERHPQDHLFEATASRTVQRWIGRRARSPTQKKIALETGQSVTPTAAVLKSWAEPMVARGDLAEEVARLKEQPGNFILAHGGARFAQSLVASGLIDEYRLVIHPVALGRGQPLFSALRGPVDLRLISVTSFGSGVVGAVYQAASTLLRSCAAQTRVYTPPPPRVYVAAPAVTAEVAAPGVELAVTASEPPPALPEYTQPPCPEDGYLWTPGYWHYGSAGYYWVPGTWVQPPRVGVLWTPGYWGFSAGVYGFHPGYWGPHIGFYGGVNYGFGFGGVGFVGGRWDGGHYSVQYRGKQRQHHEHPQYVQPDGHQ